MKLLSLLMAVLVVAGCKTIDIENGQVPSEYLHLAKKLEGTYSGKFNGIPGDLVVTIQGNQPFVEYRNANGTDILNNNCESQIGLLETVYVKGSKEDPRVDAVTFKFSPGKCALAVSGRSINFNFKDGYNKIEVSMIKNQRQERRCTWDSGNPPYSGPREVCNIEMITDHLWGTFKR